MDGSYCEAQGPGQIVDHRPTQCGFVVDTVGIGMLRVSSVSSANARFRRDPVRHEIREGRQSTLLRRSGWRMTGLGASGRVPVAEAGRPLSVQSTDLRRDARQRARCAVSGHSHANDLTVFDAELAAGQRSNSLIAVREIKSRQLASLVVAPQIPSLRACRARLGRSQAAGFDNRDSKRVPIRRR